MRPLSNPFRLLDLSRLIPTSTNKPFRLLDLPREIRDKIYHAILCDWGVQGPFHHSLTEKGDDIKLQVITHKVQPTILLANKRVYGEAKQVLLKGNQFIQIRMRARNLCLISGAFRYSQIPIVATGHDSVALFKDIVVMEHTIKFPGDPSPSIESEFNIVILGRDLWGFANGMCMVDIHSRRYAGHSKHELTILNPFINTASPEFFNAKNVGRLLRPYIRSFSGFEDVEIKGHIDPQLAQTVVATVNLEPPLPSPPIKLLDQLVTWKSRGDEHFLERQFIMALIHWNAADITIMLMRNRRAWPRFVETVGSDFTDHLTDVAFEVESCRAFAYLEMTQDDLGRGGLARPPLGWMAQIAAACSDAMEIATILGTDWTPSDDQMAALFYCWAKGHRVTENDVHFAEDTIRRADALRPDDEEIRAEMEKILEWKASVGLP